MLFCFEDREIVIKHILALDENISYIKAKYFYTRLNIIKRKFGMEFSYLSTELDLSGYKKKWKNEILSTKKKIYKVI